MTREDVPEIMAKEYTGCVGRKCVRAWSFWRAIGKANAAELSGDFSFVLYRLVFYRPVNSLVSFPDRFAFCFLRHPLLSSLLPLCFQNVRSDHSHNGRQIPSHSG